MRIVWLAAAFAGTLAVGILLGLILGIVDRGAERGTAASPRTVTVEKTIPAQESGAAIAPPAQKNVGSLAEARDAVEKSLRGYANPNLEVTEVMEFANTYYAEVRDKDTGIGAIELLVEKPGGTVYPEPGPNIMWNTKYGMMSGSGGTWGMMGPKGGGMMGSGGQGMTGPNSSGQTQPGAPPTKISVRPKRAQVIAASYLKRVSPGTQAGEAKRFYGYYTLLTKKHGEIRGMLSVNGYSGEVWYHSWHGPFIAMEEES